MSFRKSETHFRRNRLQYNATITSNLCTDIVNFSLHKFTFIFKTSHTFRTLINCLLRRLIITILHGVYWGNREQLIRHYPFTESSKYYARQQTAVARGPGRPARRLTGRQTAAVPKHSLCFLVQFPSNWSRASTHICKTEMLAFTYCDYC